MNKNGFTLVELLSVIIVLGIILVIAIPNVLDIINNTRIDTYIKDKAMMVSVTKKYLISNSNLLPVNIGDTIEVKLSDLKSNLLIQDIKDPKTNNSCNGYVLVTKIENNEYDYNPTLNCINNTIGGTVNDALMGYWTFDDFQEPTSNIYPRTSDTLAFNNAYNGTGYGFSEVNNIQQVIENTMQWNTSSVITKVSRLNSDISQKDYVSLGLSSPLNTTKILTFWYYGTYGTSIYPYNNDSSANLYYLDSNGNWVGGNTAVNIPVTTNQWQQITIKIENKGVATGMGLSWIILHYNQNTATLSNNQYWAFTMFQYEDKLYPTPYTSTTRSGIVKDHSLQNNIANLQLTSTPKWISKSHNNAGSYEFNGSSNLIATNSFSLGLNLTACVWIKPHTNITKEILIHGNYEKGAFELFQYGSSFALRGGSSTSVTGVKTLALNEWNFICGTINGTVGKTYYNGQLTNTGTVTLPNSTSNPLNIGAYSDLQYSFDGLIDDVRIYNRTLSDAEIKFIYDIEK